MASPINVPTNLGSLLLGGLLATFLSGAVTVQAIVYLKLYPQDVMRNRALVALIWFLDICHTALVWHALWGYIIGGYGNAASLDFIGWDIATSVVVTAVITFSVHFFLAHRIWKLSSKNWYLTLMILLLSVCRTMAAATSTAEMVMLHSFFEFRAKFEWLFTTGLTLSAGVDVLITASLFYLLYVGKQKATSMNPVLDSCIRYTFETGALTCAGTAVSMLCWVVMGDNLVFLGIHFGISKSYATSLLVTLNARQQHIRHANTSIRSPNNTDILRMSARPSKHPVGLSPSSPFDEESIICSKTYSSRGIEIAVETHTDHYDDKSSAEPLPVKLPIS